MQRIPFLVLALTLGCGGPPADLSSAAPSSPTVRQAPPSVPDPVPDPATPTTLALPVAGAVHRFAPPPAGHAYADAVEFLGWSDTGARYAYALRRQPEGASCSERWSLVVVDAATDTFVPDAQRSVAHDSPEGGPQGCSPPSLEPGIEAAKAEALSMAGIRVGQVVTPTLVEAGADGVLGVTLPTGARLDLRFSVTHATDELYAVMDSPGAAYALSVQGPGGGPLVVEDGQRRRPMVMRYELAGLPLFVSPDGAHAALFVRTVLPAFEGTRASVMSNGLTVQPSWLEAR